MSKRMPQRFKHRREPDHEVTQESALTPQEREVLKGAIKEAAERLYPGGKLKRRAADGSLMPAAIIVMDAYNSVLEARGKGTFDPKHSSDMNAFFRIDHLVYAARCAMRGQPDEGIDRIWRFCVNKKCSPSEGMQR